MDELSEDYEPQMNFDVATGDGLTVVRVRGELDIANVERLDEAVAPIIKKHPDRLVVDVQDLDFADSSALALWVRWATNVGEIELRNASPLLRRIVTSMGLERKLRLQS